MVVSPPSDSTTKATDGLVRKAYRSMWQLRNIRERSFPKGFFNTEVNLGCVRGHQGLMFFPKQTQIFYTNPAMTRFGQLEMPNEFVGSKCYGFLDDMKGYYWIATDQGLYRLNYQMQDLQYLVMARV